MLFPPFDTYETNAYGADGKNKHKKEPITKLISGRIGRPPGAAQPASL